MENYVFILKSALEVIVAFWAVLAFLKCKRLNERLDDIENMKLSRMEDVANDLWLKSTQLRHLAEDHYNFFKFSDLKQFELYLEKRLLPLEIDLENRKERVKEHE